MAKKSKKVSTETHLVKEANSEANGISDVTEKSTPLSGFSFGVRLSLLVLFLAVGVGLFLGQQKKIIPPSIQPTAGKNERGTKRDRTVEKKLTTLCPSTEMSRGYPNPMQAELYSGLDPAVLLVINDEDKANPVFLYWNGETKAVAPAGSRSRIESFIGHVFEIRSKSSSINVTLDIPFLVYGIDSKDGSISKLPYGKEDQVPKLEFPPVPSIVPSSTAKAIKVRNLSNKRYHSFWVPDNGAPPVYQGVIDPNSESTTTSYLTHTFRYTDLKNKSKTIFEFSVLPDQEIYAYIDEKTADKVKLQSHLEEVEFAKEYQRKHNGRPWLSFYPHGPVKTFMWPADYIGQEHHIHTEHGPDGGPFNFTLRVVSVRPRAFEVSYFISDEESNFIINQAKAKLHRSSVEMHGENGERIDSDTRTSKNAWLERSPGILDRVYRRTADLLNIPEQSLNHNPPNGCAENMQVVHYKGSARYAPHHDWGVRGGPHTRLITVLLYLNQPTAGGETTFPLAKVGKEEGLTVTPKKGKAVLFYSQFPDGNVDDESLHEARPVTKGEKWLANIWVHDQIYWRPDGD